MATHVAPHPGAAGDELPLPRLRRFVAAHPLCGDLRRYWHRWVDEAAELPEFVAPETGAVRGTAHRDLGDITPYLWLAGEGEAIDRLHGQADRHVRDGLLTDGTRVSPFDNHDYALSLYLLCDLDGRRKWRDAYLTACRSLAKKFFRTADPPAFFDLRTGKPSRRVSAFGLGLLELFCGAHRLAPEEGWLDRADRVIAEQLRHMAPRRVRLFPRVGVRFLGTTFHDYRPNRLYARLFKDNSNPLFALIQRCEFPDADLARDLASLLWREIEARFTGFEDGWVRTELRYDSLHRPRIGRPLLVGNAVIASLLREMGRSDPLAHLVRQPAIEAVLRVPRDALLRTGFLPLAPTSSVQHLDVMVDFVTAAFLCLHDRGRFAEASEIVRAALDTVGHHVTRFGYATLATAAGPSGEICVKYNFLVVKLLVCQWLAEEGDRLSPAAHDAVADTFLIDR